MASGAHEAALPVQAFEVTRDGLVSSGPAEAMGECEAFVCELLYGHKNEADEVPQRVCLPLPFRERVERRVVLQILQDHHDHSTLWAAQKSLRKTGEFCAPIHHPCYLHPSPACTHAQTRRKHCDRS